MAHIDSQNDWICCFRFEGESDEEATNRIFEVGDKFILCDLKELCPRFGLVEWNFVSSLEMVKKYLVR